MNVDILMRSRECSPQCLTAMEREDGLCDCRCGGIYHGALRWAPVEPSETRTMWFDKIIRAHDGPLEYDGTDKWGKLRKWSSGDSCLSVSRTSVSVDLYSNRSTPVFDEQLSQFLTRLIAAGVATGGGFPPRTIGTNYVSLTGSFSPREADAIALVLFYGMRGPVYLDTDAHAVIEAAVEAVEELPSILIGDAK